MGNVKSWNKAQNHSKTEKHQTDLKPLFEVYIQEKSASDLILYLKNNSNLLGNK